MALSRVLDRVGVGLAALVGVLAVAGSASAQPLQNAIEALFRDSGIGATKMGAIVIDAGTQRVLAEVNADQSYIPASNMKVVTSGAALRVLGPDFEFVTRLNFDAAGNRAVVIGSGDPAFGDPKLLEEMGISAEDLLDIWAKALRDAGFKKGGELVIDDRVFDREYVHPTWPTAQLNRWYCAEVAGVNFHTNILTIFAKPSADVFFVGQIAKHDREQRSAVDDCLGDRALRPKGAAAGPSALAPLKLPPRQVASEKFGQLATYCVALFFRREFQDGRTQ